MRCAPQRGNHGAVVGAQSDRGGTLEAQYPLPHIAAGRDPSLGSSPPPRHPTATAWKARDPAHAAEQLYVTRDIRHGLLERSWQWRGPQGSAPRAVDGPLHVPGHRGLEAREREVVAVLRLVFVRE